MSPSRTDPARRKCPVCGRATDAKFKPFCSKRCVDLDLARWLGGKYAIPGEPADKAEERGGEDE